MRFLADENCDFAIVRALRAAGYDVQTVKERCEGAEDQAIIDLAAKENLILLTEDKDFGQLVFAGTQSKAGVIYLRFPSKTRSLLAENVVELVKNHGKKLQNHFVVMQPGRIRISE